MTQSAPTSTAQPDDARAMHTIGKYRLLAELGRGGMATAYLAAAQGPGGFNKLVVVKKLRTALAAEPEFVSMFLAEARLAARINHANVVQTHEVGMDPPQCYIAMEYLEGQSLEAVVRRAAKANMERATVPPSADGGEAPGSQPSAPSVPLKLYLFAISQALAGLDHAHELKDFDGAPLKVVHRDVSPHNIMVTYDGAVKLLDFGIAKAADNSGDTRTGIMKGKCAYMPSEQFGGKNIDRRADIFAVGVMLWQAIAGRKLWRGLSDAEIFQKVAVGAIPLPSTVAKNVDPTLEAMAMKALATNREERYASAHEFQMAIDDFVSANSSYRVTARELGTYLTQLFGEDRARIKSIIEAALGKQSTTHVGPLLTLATGSPASSDSQSAPNTNVGMVSNPTQISAMSLPQQKPDTRRLLVLGGVGVAAFSILLAAILYRPSNNVVTTLPTAPTTSFATQLDSALSLRSNVTSATLYLDGKPLNGNPAAAIVPRDGKAHTVRAEAAGYTGLEEAFSADAPAINRELHLQPAAANSTTTASSTAKTAPMWVGGPRPSPTVAIAPTPTTVAVYVQPTTTAAPTGRVTKPLDTGDPWATKPAPAPAPAPTTH